MNSVTLWLYYSIHLHHIQTYGIVQPTNILKCQGTLPIDLTLSVRTLCRVVRCGLIIPYFTNTKKFIFFGVWGAKNGRKYLLKSAIYWVVFLDTNWKINTPQKASIFNPILPLTKPTFSPQLFPTLFTPPSKSSFPKPFPTIFSFTLYPHNFTYSQTQTKAT